MEKKVGKEKRKRNLIFFNKRAFVEDFNVETIRIFVDC